MQLSVGITGHRSLPQADLALLKQQIHDILAQVRSVGESLNPGATFRLISPLAEGADRLAAEAGRALHFELHAPLPFSAAEYADDFRHDPHSLSHFWELHDQVAVQTYPLPGRRSRPEAAYLAVGLKVLEMSDVLIAVWDGQPARGAGGTGDIVRRAVAAGMLVLWVQAAAPHEISVCCPWDGSLHWKADLEQHLRQVHRGPQGDGPAGDPYPAGPAGAPYPVDPAGPGRKSLLRRIPLVVGVTGDDAIDPAAAAALEAEVTKCLQELIGERSHTPVLVLSSLRPGAEQLVARVALRLQGCCLGIITPDRRSPETGAWLTQAQWEQDVLINATMPPVDETVPAQHKEAAGWALTRAYISRHAHLLLALWDGRGQGAPAATVHHHLNGVPEYLIVDGQQVKTWFITPPRQITPPESGPVFQLVRQETGAPVWRYPRASGQDDEAAARNELEYVRKNIDAFNEAVVTDAADLDTAVPDNRKAFIPLADAPGRPLPPDLDLLLERYAVADTLAMAYQAETRDATKYLLVLVAVAAFAYNFHSNGRWWFLLVYLGVLVAGILAYQRGEKRGVKSKHLDYRALAEGMRIQFIWRLAGLEDDVADHYLYKQCCELTWIRVAIRAWNLPFGRDRVPYPVSLEAVPPKHICLIRDRWMRAQQEYYRDAAKRANDRLVRQQRFVTALVVTGLSLAGAMCYWYLLRPEAPDWFFGLATAVVAELPVIAAALDTYGEKMARSEEQRQYQRTEPIFDVAVRQMQVLIGSGRYGQAQGLIEELGQQALAEHGDWANLHRTRSLPMPRA